MSPRHASDPGPAYTPPSDQGVQIISIQDLIGETGRKLRRDDQPQFFASEDQGVRLYCAGDRDLVRRRCVAIVGTREPSAAGAARARRLAKELADAGVVIVSGLARGVDTEALTSAIEAGGRVVGIIGTSLDRAYPAENRALQQQIYADHLLISQFPPGQRVFKTNFPLRNRLMAAVTDATAIIEAGDTSGTLHQATECVRLNRWLFIARSLVDDPQLTWPASFLSKPRVRPLTTTSEILDILKD